MVQDKTPFDVDAAVQCVVRKKAKKSEVKLTSPILLDTVGGKVTRKNQVKEPAGGLINVKKEKNAVPQLRGLVKRGLSLVGDALNFQLQPPIQHFTIRRVGVEYSTS